MRSRLAIGLAQLLPWLLLAIGAGVAKSLYDGSIRRDERARLEHKALADSIGVLTTNAEQLTETLERRRDSLAVIEHRYDVLVARYRRAPRTLTDTLLVASKPDTVPVPVEVVRTIVATADSTIQSCRLTLETCEQLQATKDSIIDAKDRLIKSMPKPPSGFRKWAGRVALATAAFLAGAAK